MRQYVELSSGMPLDEDDLLDSFKDDLFQRKGYIYLGGRRYHPAEVLEKIDYDNYIALFESYLEFIGVEEDW